MKAIDNNTGAERCCRLVELEERAAAIYRTLARHFPLNEELRWFWAEMSLEEKQHAMLLDFCGCHELLGGNMPDASAIDAVADFLSELEARAGRETVSIDEAFLIAAELETSEVSAIYDRLIRSAEGTWHFTKKKIETLGANHFQKILSAAGKFGVSPAVLTKLSQLQNAS